MAETNALILLPPSAVGRAIQPESYAHGLWIRWPLATNASGSNRLLSPITGLDWRFESEGIDLSRIGALDARKDFLHGMQAIIVPSADGRTDANDSILGLNDDGRLAFANPKEPIPDGALLVCSAASWDDAARVAKMATGNSIIVEYPPVDGSTVSAAWFGNDDKNVPVPKSTHVAGLLPASEIITFLTNPKSYDWQPAADASAEQWMKTVVNTRPIQLTSLFCFVLVAAGLALWCLNNEAIGRMARFAICLSLCAFVAVAIAGDLAKVSGLMPWNVLPIFAYFGLVLGFGPAYLAIRAIWPRTHPIFGIAVCAVPLLLWFDPNYSVLSSQLALQPAPVSAIALGGVIAALTLTVAQGQYGGKGPKILAGVMVVSTIALELFTHSWWMEDKALIVTPVLAMACGLNVMQLPYGIAFVAFPFFFHRWNGTIYWGLNRMITQYSDVKSINAGEQMQFLFSPAFLVSLMAFVCVTALGGKYLRHVASKGLEESYSARALFWAALSTACLGLREAYLLPAALVVAITGCLVWLFDSARSL